VTDLLRADWLFELKVEQLRRRIVKYPELHADEASATTADAPSALRSVVEGVHGGTTRRRVELRRRSVHSDPTTQLNSTSS